MPMWSYRESPLVDGDKVICTPGGDTAMLVAFDKLTGNPIWKTQMPGSSEGAPVGAGGRSNPGGGPGGPGGRAGGSAAGVTGTKDPNLFIGEHFDIRAFCKKIPICKYVLKIFFV